MRQWGYEAATGVGKHGVVASLKVGDGHKAIGLRADFDALPIQEDNDLPYKSTVEGVGHLCGHDGHTTMLLAAGEYLARTKNFNGTVRLIFQPGEETMEGGPAMIEDGLFERFPVDAVFGMHNMPGLELGKLYFTEGFTMAAVDNWEIELTGKGGHGSMPELSIDPVVAGSALVMALQTIVSRNVAPRHPAVVTVGAFQSGQAGNVVAHSAVLRLSIRTTTDEDRRLVLDRVRTLTRSTAEAYGCTYEIREGVPGAVLVNDPEERDRPTRSPRRLSAKTPWSSRAPRTSARRTSRSCCSSGRARTASWAAATRLWCTIRGTYSTKTCCPSERPTGWL